MLLGPEGMKYVLDLKPDPGQQLLVVYKSVNRGEGGSSLIKSISLPRLRGNLALFLSDCNSCLRSARPSGVPKDS